MSSTEGGAPNAPLSERELTLMRRLLSDPFSYPPELWAYIKSKVENDTPEITWDSIIGFASAVARESPSPWTTGDTKVSAQAATHADPVGGTWYLADGSAIPAGETALIALLGANFPDARGRGLVMVGTHIDVDAIGDSDPVALASRRPKHNTSVLTQPTITAPAITQPTITRTADVALSDPGHGHGLEQGSGNSTPDNFRNVAVDMFQDDAADLAANGNYVKTNTTGITVSSQPAFSASGAALASSPLASGGAYGPGGTAATDQPAYVVAGRLFYHS